MNKFVNAVENPVRERSTPGSARTVNGMRAQKHTNNACVDLFFKIGAMRGQNVIPLFEEALKENRDLALRIVLWARDVRGGAGERDTYRSILKHLEKTDPDTAMLLINKTPELGRWDDILVLDGALRNYATSFYVEALLQGNRLAAKWAPRKGPIANFLRKAMGATPKEYRTVLVKGSDTVEQLMCARKWDEINFSHVPSIASRNYRKAFAKHAPEKYTEWIEALKRKETDPTVKEKVNANAIYPHDVIRGLRTSFGNLRAIEVAEQQWKALPNYINGAKVIPIVDVSGSMTWGSVDSSGLQPIDVAVALGVYCASKNTGPFEKVLVEFSDNSKLHKLKGHTLSEYLDQTLKMHWGGSTNLHAAFKNILETAVAGKATDEDMPEILLILSDMQFNYCSTWDDRAIDMIRRKYADHGYRMPDVVFWNLNAYDNVPVSFNERGVALISGFSPAVLKSVLSSSFEELTPYGIMTKTVMQDRYNYA